MPNGGKRHMASEGARAYNGGLEQSPQRGPGGRVPGEGQGAKLPEAERIWASKGDRKFTNFSAFCKFSIDECRYDRSAC